MKNNKIFSKLISLMQKFVARDDFQTATDEMQQFIFSLTKTQFNSLIAEIGVIPEYIEHDSTEEKLYTKVSDIILAKCFIELGLKASVLKKRSNCADVVARSQYHNYSLVADAKAFRLSRTAKNPKDFKVESMVHWREDNNFSVLCCPYFQYPKNKSQIYCQALIGNVLLFSWEYFSLLLKHNIVESPEVNLSSLWDWSSIVASETTVKNKNTCFLSEQDNFLRILLNIDEETFAKYFKSFKQSIIERGEKEIVYWEEKIDQIQQYSREEAIAMLIDSLKVNEKIKSINTYIDNLRG